MGRRYLPKTRRPAIPIAEVRCERCRYLLRWCRCPDHAACDDCGGPIHNCPIHAPEDRDAWVHSDPEDWRYRVHQARPKTGTVYRPDNTR